MGIVGYYGKGNSAWVFDFISFRTSQIKTRDSVIFFGFRLVNRLKRELMLSAVELEVGKPWGT